jgi:hypothetical protein
MKTTAAPIRVDPAFFSREEIHELFLRQGPSLAAAAYLPDGSDESTPRDSAPPWFIVPPDPLCDDAWIASIYKTYTAASRGSAPRVD